MTDATLYQLAIPLGILLCLALGYFFMNANKNARIQRRIARIKNRKSFTQQQGKSDYTGTLRRKSHAAIPIIGQILASLPTQAMLRARIERAGLNLPADVYATASGGGAVGIFFFLLVAGKPPMLGVLMGLVLGIIIPYMVIGFLGAKRVKKFLFLFPDAIDFIVRGLRSGLPVPESMNMVGIEMEQPIGGIFASMGESVRLGVPLEKALQDTSKKLNSTEFNFFVTTIVLQRETGGNLSEILLNLAEVLRKRYMMRMKIKAMSSEAKASAIIVGSLPFIVTLALLFVSPGYLDPLVDDPRGHMALGIAVTMLLVGVGIMFKMSRFEI